MDHEPPQQPAEPAFRLRTDPRLTVITPYERLLTAYARDVATEPRLAEWTRATIEARLRTEPSLAHQQSRVHRNRAQLLAVFLRQSQWPTSELPAASGLNTTPLYDASRALRECGLLAVKAGGPRGSTAFLTPAGEAWLLELVQPGSLG